MKVTVHLPNKMVSLIYIYKQDWELQCKEQKNEKCKLPEERMYHLILMYLIIYNITLQCDNISLSFKIDLIK